MEKRLIFRDPDLEKKFIRDGYVIVPFLNAEERNALLKEYELLDGLFPISGFHSTMMQNDPAFRKKSDEKLRERLTEKVQEILMGYKLLFANFIVKEPSENSQVGVHQDWSYCNEELFTAVNFWVPLTPVNDTNGPLYILPGSHSLPTSIRYTPYENPPWANLFEAIKSRSKKCELKPGEAVLYHPAAIHFSPPNQSDTARIAVGFVTIPKESVPLHYFKDSDSGKEELEVYELGPEFFNHFEIGKRPLHHAMLREKIPFDHFSFTESALDSMQKRIKSEKGVLGVLKNVFSKNRDGNG